MSEGGPLWHRMEFDVAIRAAHAAAVSLDSALTELLATALAVAADISAAETQEVADFVAEVVALQREVRQAIEDWTPPTVDTPTERWLRQQLTGLDPDDGPAV